MLFETIALLAVAFTAQADEPAVSLRDAKAQFALWEKFRQPYAAESPASIGSYSAGCLAGGEALPLNGSHYSVMRPSRLRYFGHPRLLTFIDDLSRRMKREGLPVLLVGDLGRPRGGPMLSGHASHQTGLDVDLWFRLAKKRPTRKDRESLSAESYVRKGGGEVGKNWRPEHRKLVALAAANPDVDRIFVHAAIKRDLCRKFPGADWLHKVRAWWGHDDHLHVRLRCPEGSAGCERQAALDPKESQCGESLAWWFSDEAKEELAKQRAQKAERGFPELPLACHRLVEEAANTASNQ